MYSKDLGSEFMKSSIWKGDFNWPAPFKLLHS